MRDILFATLLGAAVAIGVPLAIALWQLLLPLIIEFPLHLAIVSDLLTAIGAYCCLRIFDGSNL